MNITNAKVVIKQAIKKKLTPMIWGKHGIGKSQMVAQIGEETAKERNLKFTTNPNLFNEKHFGLVDLRLGQMEVGELLGMPVRDKENNITRWLRPLWFPINVFSQGIIFLDELNRGRLDVLQAVFQLVWDRRLASHILPDGWGIIVANNPSGSDYYVNDLDPALLDRFINIKLNPETKEWISYAKNKELNEEIINYIQHYPEMLGNDGCDVNVEIKPTPRSWDMLSLMLQGLDQDLIYEVCLGLIGNEATIPFIESLKENLEKPITAKQVINDLNKWQKKIKEYGNLNAEKPRLDLLKHTADDIERVLKKDYIEKDLTDEQESNLVEFIRILPEDLAFAVMKVLVEPKRMGTDKFNIIFLKHNDLYLKLEKVSELE